MKLSSFLNCFVLTRAIYSRIFSKNVIKFLQIFHFRIILLIVSVIILVLIKNVLRPPIYRIQQDIKAQMQRLDFSTLSNRTTARKLTDLTPETGGQPIINVVLTTFRSGSTFLGEMFNYFPASYFHYEPLTHFSINRIRDEETGRAAVADLLKMFNCNFTNLHEFMINAVPQKYPVSYNINVWRRLCDLHKYTPIFLSKACGIFPVQLAKITRLSLKYGRYLLEEKNTNLRLLFLIRDPRGVLHSRWQHEWYVICLLHHFQKKKIS